MALFDFLKKKGDEAEKKAEEAKQKVEEAKKEVKEEAKSFATAAKETAKTAEMKAAAKAEEAIKEAKAATTAVKEEVKATIKPAPRPAVSAQPKTEEKPTIKPAPRPAVHAGQTPALKPLEAVAKEVIRGDWGNGQERIDKLTAAGYKYEDVQKLVNDALTGKVNLDAPAAPASAAPALKPVEEVAKEVIRGEWGNGQERVDKLTAAGYDYKTVQAKVNELLK
ncbi:MAG: hypothetical protein IIZ27_02005 [Solobacterium sp.]|nr:hypothetical protein [Solobacterium sp.]